MKKYNDLINKYGEFKFIPDMYKEYDVCVEALKIENKNIRYIPEKFKDLYEIALKEWDYYIGNLPLYMRTPAICNYLVLYH